MSDTTTATKKKSSGSKKTVEVSESSDEIKNENITNESVANKTSYTSSKETTKQEKEPAKSTANAKSAAVSAKKKYNADDEIDCKSVRYGVMRHISKKSGTTYEWADYGDITPVLYGDLLALKSKHSPFIMNPWFIIMDEQLANDWGLDEIYSYFNDFDDVEEFLQSGAVTIRRKLPSAPKGYKDLVTYTAGNMIRKGTIDSIATIKAIDDVLGKNLSMLLGG